MENNRNPTTYDLLSGTELVGEAHSFDRIGERATSAYTDYWQPDEDQAEKAHAFSSALVAIHQRAEHITQNTTHLRLLAEQIADGSIGSSGEGDQLSEIASRQLEATGEAHTLASEIVDILLGDLLRDHDVLQARKLLSSMIETEEDRR